MAKARTAGPVRRVSNVGFWLSGPELTQSVLAAGCRQTVSTKAAVDQAEDDVPHDQTSLLGRQPLISPVGFRRSSRGDKMASLALLIVSRRPGA
jgi:hypothetical protein